MPEIENALKKLEAIRAQRRWAASRRDRSLELVLAVEGYQCWRDLERSKQQAPPSQFHSARPPGQWPHPYYFRPEGGEPRRVVARRAAGARTARLRASPEPTKKTPDARSGVFGRLLPLRSGS
jgi:hypothetical protein